MLPNSNDIIFFIEIANSLNITKAAGKLGITQPTLSQSLKRLEHNIGENLVNRSKNGVELTLAGKVFLKNSAKLLDVWEKVKAETKSSIVEVKGNIKLGCHATVALYTLDLFLPDMLKAFNQLEFKLEHDLSRKITEKVIDFELDLGLVINPIKHPDLVMIKLINDEVKIWNTKKFNSDVLICNPELIQTQNILKKLKKLKDIKRIVTSDNLEVVTKLALKGAGMGIVPSRCIQLFDKNKSLKTDDKSPIFKDELFLIFRAENKNIKNIQTIKEYIIKSIK